MGKISQYTRALKAKLSDLFVVASSDNGSLSTKAVTTEQIGDAIITEQTFSDLDGKTPASAIADNTDSIGDLSSLTTSVKSSLVGAVNEVVSTKQNKITYHQETVTPDSSGSFNTGVPIDKLPLSCTTASGYISGFIYSGGYWYARIVNYAGQPVTTAVTISTWYIDNPL